MAVNKHLKLSDFKYDEIVEQVHRSLEGHLEPGKKIAGARIFYEESNIKKPKHDVIFFWRQLYVLCVDEYSFALEVFGDWDLYQRFVKSSAPYRNKFRAAWDKERELKYSSEAMKNVISAVEAGDVKESKWLAKHLIDITPKEEKKDIPSKKKESIDVVKPIDDVMEDIENSFKNLN